MKLQLLFETFGSYLHMARANAAEVLCSIGIQDLWPNKSLADGWAGGRTEPD